MTVDLTPALNVLLTAALAVFTAAVPILMPFLLKRLHIANDSDLATRLEKAADAAAGLAYDYALHHEDGLASVPVHDAAMAVGIDHVRASVPEAIAALGITPEHLAAMVKGRLGALLANDPTVSAGKPIPVPLPPPEPDVTVSAPTISPAYPPLHANPRAG